MMDFRRRWIILLSLVAISLPLAWIPLRQTFDLALHNDEYTQILLILPLTVGICFLKREWVRDAYRWGVFSGMAVLVTAVLCVFAACVWRHLLAPDVLLALEMLALGLWWTGSFVVCFGREAAQALLFPILLLFGLVPLPGIILDRMIALLQVGSAWSAHALFTLCGVPVVQHGILVAIPNLTIQVAQECSSIRSSSMLLVTTIGVAEILLRSPWRKVLLIALAIPLSVAKNGLRIFAIAMLGTRVDPDYLTGSLHREGGIVFFAIALAGVFVILAVLQRGETHIVRSSLQRPSAAATGD